MVINYLADGLESLWRGWQDRGNNTLQLIESYNVIEAEVVCMDKGPCGKHIKEQSIFHTLKWIFLLS